MVSVCVVPQIYTTAGFKFRALLTKGGDERLELAKV
jgi:hypothetical protein